MTYRFDAERNPLDKLAISPASLVWRRIAWTVAIILFVPMPALSLLIMLFLWPRPATYRQLLADFAAREAALDHEAQRFAKAFVDEQQRRKS